MLPNKIHLALFALCVLVAASVAFIAGAWAEGLGKDRNQATAWHWPDSMDSVNAAPKNHKVLFENDHIRLLEVTVQPGETEEMHGHKYPSVFVMDALQPRIANHDLEKNSKQPDRQRGKGPRPPRADDDVQYPVCHAMTTPQAPHQVTVKDSFPQHFYRMEFKKIDGDAIKSMKKYPPE